LRILCLLEADQIQTHFTFSTIRKNIGSFYSFNLPLLNYYLGVTLYPLNRQVDEPGEIQPALQWKIKRIFDAKGQLNLFYYAELQSIRLMKSNTRGPLPLYNSKLCQLQFQLKISVNSITIIYLFHT